MARLPRLFIPGCPILLELQGVSGQDVFKVRDAFEAFHQRLPESAAQEQIRIFAYCLTPRHAMFLVGVPEAERLGRFVQDLNRHFVSALKQIEPDNSGCVWEPRFKSTVIQPGIRSLKTCLFTETQAGLRGYTSDSSTYPWSSFQVHVGITREPWLSDLPSYWQLGNTPFEREAAYRRFAEQGVGLDDQALISDCLQKGWLWADDLFAENIQSLANRAVRPRPRGRPRSGA